MGIIKWHDMTIGILAYWHVSKSVKWNFVGFVTMKYHFRLRKQVWLLLGSWPAKIINAKSSHVAKKIYIGCRFMGSHIIG